MRHLTLARRALAALALAAAAVPAVVAAFPNTPTQGVLSAARSWEELRARLDSLGQALAPGDPLAAGEAYYYFGLSADRAGMRDSALAAFQRAIALRGNREELLAAADVRLRREGPGDGAAAVAILLPMLQEGAETGMGRAQVLGRLAWGYFLADRLDSAAMFIPAAEELLSGPLEWRYRIGRVALAKGEAEKAYRLLYPVAVASRMKDDEVMADLRAAATKMRVASALQKAIELDLHNRDARVQRAFAGWGGRRVMYTGTDGFPLTGIALPPVGPPRRLGAVVLMAPGDTVAVYDSLAVTLQRAGLAVVLVPPRGSDWAVAASLPIPDAWVGREEDLQRVSSRDAPLALRALARVTPVDTTRYLLVGVSNSAMTACLATAYDRHVRGLVLVSPAMAGVDRGTARAALAAAKVPAFFQIAPEDFNASYELSDYLYQAGARAASRVVEAKNAGHATLQFRADSSLGQRLVGWIGGVLKSSAAPPRAPRRRR